MWLKLPQHLKKIISMVIVEFDEKISVEEAKQKVKDEIDI